MRFWRQNSQVAFSLGVAMGVRATILSRQLFVVSGQLLDAVDSTYSLTHLLAFFQFLLASSVGAERSAARRG
jgi:hypothetical protein